MSSDSKVGSIDHMSTFPDTIYRMSLNKGLRAWSGTQAQMWSYMLVNMVGCASPSLEKNLPFNDSSVDSPCKTWVWRQKSYNLQWLLDSWERTGCRQVRRWAACNRPSPHLPTASPHLASSAIGSLELCASIEHAGLLPTSLVSKIPNPIHPMSGDLVCYSYGHSRSVDTKVQNCLFAC
jgi:hypothetical protein